MATLTGPVGDNCANNIADVAYVQALLNSWIIMGPMMRAVEPLVIDGKCGKATIMAIRVFQVATGAYLPDGKISPNGPTFKKLNGPMLYAPPVNVEKARRLLVQKATGPGRGEIPCDSSQQGVNLRHAQQAVNYARAKLRLGAANKWEDVKDSNGEVLAQHFTSRVIRLLKPNSQFIHDLEDGARFAENSEAGNCFEHAAVAFIRLRTFGVQPIEFFTLDNADHCFVVIGRDVRSRWSNPSNWGAEPAICDPWQGSAYSADRIDSKMVGGANPQTRLQIRWPSQQEREEAAAEAIPDNVG